jgi:hypothetical protein
MLNVLFVALVIHACVYLPAVLITAVRYDAGKRAGQSRGSPRRPTCLPRHTSDQPPASATCPHHSGRAARPER